MKKLAVIYLYLLPLITFGQLEVPTSQYLFNQSFFNPAYSGIHEITSINVDSRFQWMGIDGAPVTHMLNVHTEFAGNMGTGLLIISDNFGINNNLEALASYAYRIETSNATISLGLQGGIVSFRYDYAKLDTEFSDPTFVESGESFTKPNVGAGIFVQSDNYYFGFSVPKFLNVVIDNGTVTSTRYRRHYYISGGYLFDNLFAFKFKPSFLFRTVDGGYRALDINLSALINERIWAGASFRNFTDAISLHSILEVNESMRAGMSFEISSRSFTGANYGTLEIMIAYDLGSVGNRYW